MAELYWIRTPEMTDMFSEGYIGMSTLSAKRRWAGHKAAAKVPEKQHLPIYRAFAKYGVDGLVLQVLVSGPDDYITALETQLRPTEGIGWNCAAGGQDTGKGRTQSEAHKQKCAVANLGKKRSEELKQRQSEIMTGLIKITDEGRKKLSDHHKNLPPWKHSQSNKKIWTSAIEAFNFSKLTPFSQRQLSKHFEVKDSTVSALYEKLKSGWNPNEDTNYQEWLSLYNKNKEQNEATPVT